MVRWSQSKEARLSPIHFESSRSKYTYLCAIQRISAQSRNSVNLVRYIRYADDVRHLDGRMQFVDPQRDLDLRAEHNSRNARRAANFQTERYRSPDDRARSRRSRRTPSTSSPSPHMSCPSPEYDT